MGTEINQRQVKYPTQHFGYPDGAYLASGAATPLLWVGGGIGFYVNQGDGNYLEYAVNCKGGEKRVFTPLAKRTNAAIVDCYLNGTLVAAGLDQYAASGIRYVHLYPVTLKAGRNILRIKANGKNPLSSGYAIFTGACYARGT
ncbi:MAG: hypothetical protein WC683_07580 [bacterium]